MFKNIIQCTVLTVAILFIFVELPAFAGSSTRYEHPTVKFNDSAQKDKTNHEIFRYALKWGLLRVGNATLESHSNNKRCTFKLKAWSTWYVDLFFPVKTTVNSTCSPDRERSYSYLKNYQEDIKVRNFKVNFDWKGLLIHRRDLINGVNSVRPLRNKILDPLSVFFAFRNGSTNKNLIRIVSDGIRIVRGKAEFVGHEEIKIPFGKFQALHYRVDLGDVDGIFFTRDYTPYDVWISDDTDRLPLKLEAPIKIGPYTGTLTGLLYATK